MSHLLPRIGSLDAVPEPLRAFYSPSQDGSGYQLNTSPAPIAARDASLAAALGNPTPPTPTPAPSNPGAAPTAKPPLGSLNRDDYLAAIDGVIPHAPKPQPEGDDDFEDWGADRKPRNIRLRAGASQAEFEAAVAEAARRGGRVEFAEEPDAPPAYTPTANDIVVPTGCDQRAFERAVEEAYRKGGRVVFGPPEEPKPEDAARDDSRRNAQGDFERAVAKARAEGRDFDYAAHFAQENG